MRFTRNINVTIFFFFLFLCSTTMYAATITWDGDSGDGEWTTAANWDGNVLPSSTDDVVIDLNDEVTLSSGTHTVKSIDLKEASRFIISAGVVLNINVNNNSTVGMNTSGNTILTNNGTINITDGFNNLNLLGRLNNNAGAVIYGTSASQTGVWSADKGIYYYGIISMDGAGSTNFSINSQSYNYASGQMISTNSGWAGISIPSNFDNYGTISDDNSNKQSINLTGGSTTITNHFGGSISSTNALTQGIFIGNSAYFNNEGNVTVSNATGLAFQNFNLFTNAGNLQGTGTFDLGGADLGGTVIPGTSPGAISFTADQTFLASNTLEIEVDGTTPGTEHDQIAVTGTATISGTLAPTINYTPTNGDRIVILTASNISGSFSTISPALPDDWMIDYSVPGEVALKYEYTVGKWDGGGGDGEWTTASNWQGNILPSSTDDVVIDLNDEVTLSSGTHTVRSIDLKEASRLIISAGVVLNINVNNNSTVGMNTSGNTILTNNGTINITDGFNNLNLLGRLNNNAGAVIYGTSASQTGVWSADKGIYNYGIISMDGAGSTNFSINSQSYNYPPGQMISTNSGWAGISIPSNFDNYGTISDDNSNKQSINLTGGSTTITNHFGGSISSTNASTQGIFIGNSAYFNNEGNVTVSNATGLAFQNFNLFTNAGNLQGTGTFDLGGADLGGTVIPGSSPGSISFTADQTFLASNTLEIEVDGTTPGTEHDQIAVTGTATISGTLATTINYTPVSNDRIVILTAATISGTFGSISPALAADWALDYSIPGEVALVFSGILPIELTHFSAKAMATSVQLEWQTVSEIKNKGFEIQHSVDGIAWSKIGFVAGHGDSEFVKNYHFQHEQANQGLNYYRLKQMDFDGKIDFSSVEVVEFNRNEIAIQVFPNPVDDMVFVKMEGLGENSVYQLFDSAGRVVLQGRFQSGGLNGIDVGELAGGHYVISVRANDFVYAGSLVIR